MIIIINHSNNNTTRSLRPKVYCARRVTVIILITREKGLKQLINAKRVIEVFLYYVILKTINAKVSLAPKRPLIIPNRI